MSLKHETKLDAEFKSWLAFAEEKLSEVGLLAQLVNQSGDSAALLENRKAIASRRSSPRIHDAVVKLRAEAVSAADLQRQEADFICEIDAARADESFETSADSELVRFLEASSGKTAGTVAFGTEAPSMIDLGAEAVVFGPGDIRVAHRTGEFVPVDELNECVHILQKAIERFCG